MWVLDLDTMRLRALFVSGPCSPRTTSRSAHAAA